MRRTFAALMVGLLTFVALGAAPAQAHYLCPSTSVCLLGGVGSSPSFVSFDHDPNDRPGCFNVPDNAAVWIDNNSSYTDHNMRVYNGSSSCSSAASNAIVYAGTDGAMSGQWYKTIDSFYLY